MGIDFKFSDEMLMKFNERILEVLEEEPLTIEFYVDHEKVETIPCEEPVGGKNFSYIDVVLKKEDISFENKSWIRSKPFYYLILQGETVIIRSDTESIFPNSILHIDSRISITLENIHSF